MKDRPKMMNGSEDYLTIIENEGKQMESVKYFNYCLFDME